MRLNWRKIVLLILICELLLIYWSTLQHTETVRLLKEEQERSSFEQPLSSVPQPEPTNETSVAPSQG